jgi:hypothetical protein
VSVQRLLESITDMQTAVVRGDLAIRLTADVLRALMLEFGDEDAFPGHVGGDDFVVPVSSDRAEEFSEAASGFRERIRSLYDPADLERGWIMAASRKGEVIRHRKRQAS